MPEPDVVALLACPNGCQQGIVSCWNPGGPCPTPPPCDLCGPCSLCALDVTITRVSGEQESYPNRPWTAWNVTYKGHYLGRANSEEAARYWVEDMRRMEEGGDYDPIKAEADRVAFLSVSAQRGARTEAESDV